MLGRVGQRTTPRPSPLPRKLALASLPLQDVRIRKRMRTGEGDRRGLYFWLFRAP